MKRLSIFLYALIMFLVVYNPPFMAGLSLTTIAVLLSVVICVFYATEFKKLFRIRSIKKIFLMVAFFLLYDVVFSTIAYFLSGNDLIISNLRGDFVSHISICLVACGIVVFALKRKWSLERLCATYLIAGLYQAVLGVICLISPSIKSFFTGLIIANSSSDKIRSSAEFFMAIRNFGFASTLYDIFGMAMSVLAVLAITQGLKGEKKFFLIGALITVAAFINARTSFVLISVGTIIMMLSRGGKKVTGSWFISRLIFFTAAIASVAFFFTWLLGNATTEQLEWLATALTDSQSMLEGEKVGYYDSLANSYIIFPSDLLSVMFGTGMTPADAINHNSDVGYIQYIWKHGVVGSILLYLIYFKLFKYAQKWPQWPYSSFVVALAVMVSIYLVKLTCLGYSMASVIFVPICLYMIVVANESRDTSIEMRRKLINRFNKL